MRELSEKEKDLLYRVETKPEIQPFFFKKAKGLHWFDALNDLGFFKPQNNPRPIPRMPTKTIIELLCSAIRQLPKKYRSAPVKAKSPPRSKPMHAAQNVLLLI